MGASQGGILEVGTKNGARVMSGELGLQKPSEPTSSDPVSPEKIDETVGGSGE